MGDMESDAVSVELRKVAVRVRVTVRKAQFGFRSVRALFHSNVLGTMKSLLLILFVLYSAALISPAAAQELNTDDWVSIPNSVDLPSEPVVQGQVVWPDGSPVANASVVLTIDDSAPILENKYQSLLEMKTGADGRFVFMGHPYPKYLRVVAAARPVPVDETSDEGTAPRAEWAFGQYSKRERADWGGDVRIVLDRPLLKVHVEVTGPEPGSGGVAGVFLEPRTRGVVSNRVGTHRINPTNRFQKDVDMRRSALPQEAPWYQEFKMGEVATVWVPGGRWRLWSTAENCTMSRMESILAIPDRKIPKASLVMTARSGISGRVVSHDGKGIERAKVGIIFEDDYDDLRTGEGGKFSFAHAKAGKYKMWATASGHTTIYTFGIEIPVGGLHDYELKMGPPGAIQGSVDPAWMRPGLMVAMHIHDSEYVQQWVPVQGDGTFRFDGITEGWYRLRLTAMPPGFRYWRKDDFRDYMSHEWSPRPGEHKGKSPWDVPRLNDLFAQSGVHMYRLEVKPGQTLPVVFDPPVEGHVRVRGTFVDARNEAGRSSLLFRRMKEAAWTKVAWIQPNGDVVVDLPSKGQYQVHWMRENLSEHCANWWVDVDSGPECRLDLKAPSASLRVKFLDDQGNVMPQSNDLFGEYVTLKHRTRFIEIPFPDRSKRGEIFYDNLPAGDYVLYGAIRQEVPKNDRNWRSIWGMPLWVVPIPVDIALTDQAEEITVRLLPAAYVDGVVRDKALSLQTSGVSECAVYVWTDDKRTRSIHLETCNGDISSGSLRFQFSGLPQGQYYLSVEPTRWVDNKPGSFESPMIPIDIEGDKITNALIDLSEN